MGLHQFLNNSSSHIQRLLLLIEDEENYHKIPISEWPLAMSAYVLSKCEQASFLQNSEALYNRFFAYCPDQAVRMDALNQLASFIFQQRGICWQAPLPFALYDSSFEVRLAAASVIGKLAPKSEQESPFTGFNKLVSTICSHNHIEAASKASLLDAILETADLRLLPLSTQIIDSLSEKELSLLLKKSQVAPNALSCEWALSVLEKHPVLANDIAAFLIHSAPRANEILDIILPIPSWKFQNFSPQSLHGWRRSEYFSRMKPRLINYLSCEQIENVKQAWMD